MMYAVQTIGSKGLTCSGVSASLQALQQQTDGQHAGKEGAQGELDARSF